MRGLLVKEMVSAKGLMNAMIMALILMVVYGIIGLNVTAFVIFFIGLLANINLFDFDDKCQWDQYAITLPVRRRDIVRARYVFVLLVLFIAFVFGTVTSLIFGKVDNVEEMLYTNILVTTIVIMYLSIYMPLLYKYGVIKGRYISIFSLALFMAVCAFMNMGQDIVVDVMNFINTNFGGFINYLPYLVLIISLMVYWLSQVCAARIYEKKDY